MKCDAIVSDPEVLSGTPVFRGTRVPVTNRLDYLEGGDDIGEFLEDFPSVTKEQVVEVLEATRMALIVLSAQTNWIEDLAPLLAQILDALDGIRPGDMVRIPS
jgi:uncharacterized protein (DUF433 family)